MWMTLKVVAELGLLRDGGWDRGGYWHLLAEQEPMWSMVTGGLKVARLMARR